MRPVGINLRLDDVIIHVIQVNEKMPCEESRAKALMIRRVRLIACVSSRHAPYASR